MSNIVDKEFEVLQLTKEGTRDIRFFENLDAFKHLVEGNYILAVGNTIRLTVCGENRLKALLLSKDPCLLKRFIDEIGKKIVGESDTIKTIFLCAMGSLVENCQLASYNLIVNDESGAGKDWVTDKTLSILPQNRLVKRTRITEKVLTYWHNPISEPDWTWDGKVFYNEDISRNVLNGEVFKTFASSGSNATVLVNQVPVDITINGKPVLVVTMATTTPSAETLRRFVIVNLDTGVDQTKAIMLRQAELAKKGISIEYDESFTEALSLLTRCKVKIPFADKLPAFFPNQHIIMRTHFQRFLDYIKASCALHQYQRESDEEGFLLATGQDYDIAREVLLKVTSNPIMIPLTKDQKKLLDIIKGLGSGCYSVADLEPHVTFMTERWLRTQLDKLANYGFLRKSSQKQDYSDKSVMVYTINDIADIKNIPTWNEMQN